MSWKNRIIFVYTLLLILIACQETLGQAEPFADEIRAFTTQDSLQPPPQNAVLFVGSSSFRLWPDINKAFPGYKVINRGFGGSSIPDVIRYADQVIFPYNPKQVIIYCGENDIASDTVDSKMVSERFKTLFNLIRERLPQAQIVFVSIKPSPSREKYLPIVKQANQIIKNFLWQQPNTIYVDVFSRMIDANGKPRPELFVEDRLHMTPEGYKIWQTVLQPYLMRS
jgi:lysophospholipase L1-like esterase